MTAECYSETSVHIYHTARRHERNVKVCLHTQHLGNLALHTAKCF